MVQKKLYTNNSHMEQKEKLDQLNQEKLAKIEEYLKSKEGLGEADQEKISEAKKEWQAAWNKFLEVLMVLERLEI